MAKVSKSPWLLHYDASSCNGCDIEVLDCLTLCFAIMTSAISFFSLSLL